MRQNYQIVSTPYGPGVLIDPKKMRGDVVGGKLVITELASRRTAATLDIPPGHTAVYTDSETGVFPFPVGRHTDGSPCFSGSCEG